MGLKRRLSTLDLVILGVGGAVGTGVLFSNAGMAEVAGPGVVLAWLVGAIFYTFIGFTYVELARAFPEAGGPSRYSVYTHGRVTNLINAFSDLIWYLFVPPIEALATVEGLNYFYPHFVSAATGFPTVLGAVAGAIVMFLFLPFNYYGIRWFRNATDWFGGIKLLLYVLVAIGFISFAHFGNFSLHGGFMPFGMAGVFAAIPFAMFAFGGIRVIPDYAEESTDAKRSMGRSIIITLIGQTVIYILFAVAFLASLNWAQVHIPTGDWAKLTTLPGNPFLAIVSGKSNMAWLLVATVIIAIIGPFITGYIYQGGGSRVLFAMARTGFVSRQLKDLNQRYAIPSWSLVVFAVVGAVVAFISEPLPGIYSLITDAVVAGYLGFAVNPVAMLALRRQGRPGTVRGGGVLAVLAFGSAGLIAFWSGWPSVPYAVALLAVGSLGFGIAYRVRGGFKNAIWYMVFILFVTGMTYINSGMSKPLVTLDQGSVIVAVASMAIFLPWGVASRLEHTQTEEERAVAVEAS